jgi:hypothetical protein
MTTEFEKLITAIIISDVGTVRQLVKDNPAINKIKTKNNQYPIELARAKGLKKIEAILLLSWDDNRIFYSDLELKKFIGQLISELSEDYFCSWWEPMIEFEFWRNGIASEITLSGKVVALDKIEMGELLMLATRLGYWAYWNDNLNENVQPIALRDWRRKFARSWQSS